MNDIGCRDTDRALMVRSATGIEAFKKHRHLEAVNRAVLAQTPPDQH